MKINKVININKLCFSLACFVILIFACTYNKSESIERLTDIKVQDSVFKNLVQLTQGTIPQSLQDDSLAFLVLPVQASCPSCRNKTIESIVNHSGNLAARHFVIISADGGRKTINGYFRENDSELPVIPDKLFLDSTNLAKKFKLYDEKPTIYYTFKRKAFKKVAAIPATVKEDLKEFFSGYRNDKN